MKGKKGKKMKKLKRIFSALLALAMVFSLSVPAFAEGEEPTKPEGPMITVAEHDTHTYKVYQIFTGRYSNGVLSDVKWGKNGVLKDENGVKVNIDVGSDVNEKILGELQGDALGTAVSDNVKLSKIIEYVDLESECYGTVDSKKSLPIVDGYYLIKDEGPVSAGDAFSRYIVKTGGNIAISTKKDAPSVKKSVLEINDSTKDPTKTNLWYDAADYDIGDEVTFKLTATMPKKLSEFNSYLVTFHDTLSKGLTLDISSVQVFLKSEQRAATREEDNIEITNAFKITSSTPVIGKPTELTISCDNIKDEKLNLDIKDNSIIEVVYKATLNNQAVIGSAGNINTVYLEYTNNPHTNEIGETEEDLVKVFTFQLKIFKVNKGNEPLKGAKFTLYKRISDPNDKDPESTKKVEVPVTSSESCPDATGDAENEFNWTGLDSGDYTLKETTVPDGYNSIAPINFTINAGYNVNKPDPELFSLSATGFDNYVNSTLVSGLINTSITNNNGTNLPETGGIGTTIFHVGGAILVVGAAILLVVRKKVSEEK